MGKRPQPKENLQVDYGQEAQEDIQVYTQIFKFVESLIPHLGQHLRPDSVGRCFRWCWGGLGWLCRRK